MEELKSNVHNVLRDLNKSWRAMIMEAQQTGKIDQNQVMEVYEECVQKVNNYFREFSERNPPQPKVPQQQTKKGWF